MKIAITYNADTHLKPHLNAIERLGEDEVADAALEVHAALSQRHECRLFAVGDCIATALVELRAYGPDVVFNLCEGVLGRSRWEAHFVLALDLLGLPYCGCDAVTLALTQDKGLIKQLLRQIGAPTPEGCSVAPGGAEQAALADIRALLARAASGRVIVKPSREDGGIGVDAGSVVASAEDALARCRTIWAVYQQPALVEVFLDGKEYNLALYSSAEGLVTLPPGEIVFAAGLRPEARVVGWRAKWDPGSVEDLATESRIVAHIDPALHAEIVATCRHVAAMMSMTGYVRFDMRQGPDGRLQIIDINANPDIGAGSGFRRALAAAGLPFHDFLDGLIDARLHSRREPWRSAA